MTTGVWDDIAVHSVMTNLILLNGCRHLQCGSVEHQEYGFHQPPGRIAQVNIQSQLFFAAIQTFSEELCIGTLWVQLVLPKICIE